MKSQPPLLLPQPFEAERQAVLEGHPEPTTAMSKTSEERERQRQKFEEREREGLRGDRGREMERGG